MMIRQRAILCSLLVSATALAYPRSFNLEAALGRGPCAGSLANLAHRDLNEFGPAAGRNDDPRQVVLNQTIWANVRFPQMNPAIELSQAVVYLTNPVLAGEFDIRPSDDEVRRFGQAMNAIHQRLGIPRRTAGHPELQKPEHAVSEQRLWGFIRTSNGRSITIVSLISENLLEYRLGRERFHNWRDRSIQTIGWDAVHRLGLLDHVFESPETRQIARDLARLGQVFRHFLHSAEVKRLSSEYLNVLRNHPMAENPAALPARNTETTRVTLAMRRHLESLLQTEVPDLTPRIPFILEQFFGPPS